MNKKVLLAIWFVLMVLIGVTATYASINYPKDDALTLIDKKYHIKAFEDEGSGTLYQIDVDDSGTFKIVEEISSSATDNDTQKNEYEGKFSSEEFDSFKKVILTLNNMYSLNGNNQLFNYDYSQSNEISTNDKKTILKFAKTITDFGKQEIKGKEWFVVILEELGASNGKYKEVKFTEKKVKDDFVNIGERQVKVQVRDKTVFIDEEPVNMENDFDEIYTADVDGDGALEFITRTYDLRISPPTNYYYIYRLNDDNTVSEALKISIMGSIDTFYVDGKKLMIKYEPFEAKTGYVEVGNYTLK